MRLNSASHIASVLKKDLIGNDTKVNQISIDTRTLNQQDVYIAIKGENLDGHDYIEQAIEKGAALVITEKALSHAIPHIIVDNTTHALGQLAKHHRENVSCKIIGLTGSMGKTTTKAMLASILRQQHQVLAPKVSMNNAIGVPLTLLQINETHDYAVIEMGTNHFGEIEYLTRMVQPDVVMLLNIAGAHLEFLKSLEGVFKEKSTIFLGLQTGGTAILNADDDFYQRACEDPNVKQHISFGINHQADVMARNITIDADSYAHFDALIGDKVCPVSLNIAGRHNVMNALAAIAAAKVVGIDLKSMQAGLNSAAPAPKRLAKYKGKKGSLIVDDSYSAIPNAVIAALEILANSQHKKAFIFGGMAELIPEDRIKLHHEVGSKAKQLGIDYLFAMSPLAKETVKAFGENAYHFEDKKTLLAAVEEILSPELTVLVKGSRGIKMEEVVQALRDN